LDDLINHPDSLIQPYGGRHIWETTAGWDEYTFERAQSLQSDFFLDEVVQEHLANRLTDFTRPSTKDWAGNETGIAITNIRYEDDYMTFDVYYDCLTVDTLFADTAWSGTINIVEDLTIPENVTVTISTAANVNIVGCDLHILGELNFAPVPSGPFAPPPPELHLKEGAALIVDGDDAQLLLNWGTIITGQQTSYYFPANNPNDPNNNGGDGSITIPGEQIIARNGGRISTPSIEEYEEFIDTNSEVPDMIYVSSATDDNWLGIEIEDPPVNMLDNTCWFTNCDISGINTIKMTSDGVDFGELNFYKSEFHDAGQISVHGGTVLSIRGCTIYDNSTTPIEVFQSTILMSEDNDGYGNGVYYSGPTGRGIYVLYATQNQDVQSTIRDTEFDSNYMGCYIRDHIFNSFQENEVTSNSTYGMFCWGSTVFDGESEEDSTAFAGNVVANNGAAEFVGYKDAYRNMANNDNTFADAGYSGGMDRYLVYAVNWQAGDDFIDLQGNDIAISDTTRFYPYYSAYLLDSGGGGGGSGTAAQMMMGNAQTAVAQQDYVVATSTLEQLVAEYPETYEAGDALQLLFTIENLTDHEFEQLRQYLNELDPSEESPLAVAKTEVMAKSYMSEGDYASAVEQLEIIIADPASEDQLIYAMIDEAYCYHRLQNSDGNLRAGLPQSTVRAKTMDEFREISEQLEQQLSINRLLLADHQSSSYSVNVPSSYSLSQNYPNPFNPVTTIEYALPVASEVQIKVYDVSGRLIKTLVDHPHQAGVYSVLWTGINENGDNVPSGLYLYTLETPSHYQVKRMIMLK